jgi:hypothetical protein
MSLERPEGTKGTILLVAFVVTLLGGILAAVRALQELTADGIFREPARDALIEGAAVLVLAIVAGFAAMLAWKQQTDLAGVLAIVAGLGFLLFQPELAGILALGGGIMLLVAPRLKDPQETKPEGPETTHTSTSTGEGFRA